MKYVLVSLMLMSFFGCASSRISEFNQSCRNVLNDPANRKGTQDLLRAMNERSVNDLCDDLDDLHNKQMREYKEYGGRGRKM